MKRVAVRPAGQRERERHRDAAAQAAEQRWDGEGGNSQIRIARRAER